LVELLSDLPKKPKVAEKEQSQEEEIPKKIPPIPVLQTLPVKNFQDYSLELKDQKDVIFLRRLEEAGRLSDPRELPSMKEVFSYISNLATQPPWYKACQNSIINSKSLKFPVMDVLTRGYIKDFLRVGVGNELVCNNPTCESMRMGGFRIRAIRGTWCYLCHLFYTNKLYFESLNRKNDNAKVYHIHEFMVQVDIIGEYRLDMTLMGDQNVKGIYGPFPLFHTNNYTPIEGNKGWIESDSLVFQPTHIM
jgi:hypothetical protein